MTIDYSKLVTAADKLAAAKQAALSEVRAMRADLFTTLAGMQGEALARGNTADAMAIAVVQQGARDITTTDLSVCTSKAEIDAKFLAAWIAILGAAPASVVLAFRGLTA